MGIYQIVSPRNQRQTKQLKRQLLVVFKSMFKVLVEKQHGFQCLQERGIKGIILKIFS